MGGRGRPKKGFKKFGSVKKSVANEGSSLVLKTESTPKTAVFIPAVLRGVGKNGQKYGILVTIL